MKEIAICILCLICIGCHNTSDILPDTRLKHLEEYHCWPYDVNVYSLDEVKIDSLLFIYPLNSYYRSNPKYKTTTWTMYSGIDTTIWYGMDKTLEQCEENTELFNQILKRDDVYYAGKYQYIKNKQGDKRRRYDEILFLDIRHKKLHIFKDINKLY